jgi:hypothetical protein
MSGTYFNQQVESVKAKLQQDHGENVERIIGKDMQAFSEALQAIVDDCPDVERGVLSQALCELTSKPESVLFVCITISRNPETAKPVKELLGIVSELDAENPGDGAAFLEMLQGGSGEEAIDNQ